MIEFVLLFILLSAALHYFVFRRSPTDDKTPATSSDTQTPESAIAGSTERVSSTLLRDTHRKTFESAAWLNTLIALTWPHLGELTKTGLTQIVEPLINSYLPKRLSNFRFIKCDLGRESLRIDRVTVHSRHEDSIALDLDVHFQGTPNIQMKCSPMPSFSISGLEWSGRLSLILRPLITKIPMVGAVTAAFVSSPFQKFEFTSPGNISEFSPVAKLIDKIIQEVMNQLFVFPNKFLLFKLSNAIDFFEVYYSPVCVMKVTVEKGSGFTDGKHAASSERISQIQLRVKFGQERLECPRVAVGNDLVWNKTKLFVVHDLEQPLSVKAYTSEFKHRSEVVGKGEVFASRLMWEKSCDIKLAGKEKGKAEENAVVKIHGERLDFSNSSEGPYLISVVVDKGTGFPSLVRTSMIRIKLKDHLEESVYFAHSREDIPGSTSTNPCWCQSWDLLCENLDSAILTLEVFGSRKVLGRIVFEARGIFASGGESLGWFDLTKEAKIRAKVMVRGLSTSLHATTT